MATPTRALPPLPHNPMTAPKPDGTAISAPAIREPGLPRLVISCELSAYGQVAFGEMRDWNSESPPHAACPSWLHTS